METKQELWKLFDNVNKWLEFAEKKNAVIFSMISITSFIVVIINANYTVPIWLKWQFVIFLILYCFSFFIVIISLFPTISISKKILNIGKNKKLFDTDNLLFFCHIDKYSLKEFKKSLNSKYGLNLKEIDEYDDLLSQIIINSSIITKKYTCFKISSVILIIAILELLISIIIHLW